MNSPLLTHRGDPSQPPGKRILVPVDFSACAHLALRTAFRLARSPEDVVHLFYVPGFYAKTAEDRAVAANPFCDGAENAGKQLLARARSKGNTDIVVETLPQMGMPRAEVVADMAMRLGSTLIVLAGRRSSFWERLFHRCPAEQLRRIAPCPLHLVNLADEIQDEPGSH